MQRRGRGSEPSLAAVVLLVVGVMVVAGWNTDRWKGHVHGNVRLLSPVISHLPWIGRYVYAVWSMLLISWRYVPDFVAFFFGLTSMFCWRRQSRAGMWGHVNRSAENKWMWAVGWMRVDGQKFYFPAKFCSVISSREEENRVGRINGCGCWMNVCGRSRFYFATKLIW
jgi:hypothetical protein